MTAPYGALTIGRLTLTEPFEVAAKSGDQRTLTLSGVEADETFKHPTQDQLRAKAEALLAYAGKVVPVRFAGFPHLDGFYAVGSPGADETTWYERTFIEWGLDLTLVGRQSSVEFESRLVGGNRVRVAAATPELWHAPPAGHDTYMAGATVPGFVSRVSETGTVTVYRSLTGGVNPRWGVTPAQYLAGAASVTVNGALLTGRTCDDTPGSWVVSNGIVKVEPRLTAGVFRVSAWGTSAWGASKVFDVKRNGVSLGAAQHVTVLRNDPCEVVVRLTWDHAPARSTVDVAVKRGARHAALTCQQSSVAGPWRVDDNGGGGTVSDQLTAAGYIERQPADGDGNFWVMGTTVACAAAGTFGFAASSPAQVLPAFIGVVRGGASAAAGDGAAAVNAQYLGTPAESERVIAR